MIAIEPWAQQPGESAQAYHAFRHYADMDPQNRSTAAAEAAHRAICRGGKPVVARQRNSGQWGRWSVRHQWRTRAAAGDRHMDEQARRGREAEILAARTEAAARARAMSSAVMAPAVELARRIEAAKGENTAALAGLGIGELVRLVIQGGRALPGLAEMRAVALGDVGSRDAVTVEPSAANEWAIEAERRWLGILEEALRGDE